MWNATFSARPLFFFSLPNVLGDACIYDSVIEDIREIYRANVSDELQKIYSSNVTEAYSIK